MAEEIVQFVPFASFVGPSFWHKLAELKIDVDRLEDVARPVRGFFSNTDSVKCSLEVDYTAFSSEFTVPHNHCQAIGTIYNKNTIEDFRGCDKTQLMKDEGNKLIELFKEWFDDPSQLIRFVILSYADLKKFDFYYCFGFPIPIYANSYVVENGGSLEVNALAAAVKDLKPDLSFCVFQQDNDDNGFTYKPISSFINPTDNESSFRNTNLDSIYFAFSDPSTNEKPGWPLRIYIAALLHSCPSLCGQVVNVICLRNSRRCILSESKLMRIRLSDSFSIENVQWLGWELNSKGKFAPKLAAMSESLDPERLAENSVNLNLKLMKWRLMPDLNLNRIAEQKCLLFGAGTLGCGVARNLLSWGVKHITFLDSGHVSYSNPVRQNLYRHEDALNKRAKAETAAQRVLEICPGVTAKGHSIHIPMPGHTVGDSMRAECADNFKRIEDLVKEHDVLFLLTDSRESRWLPTVMGAVHGKMVMNSALGFDSYLVMRHGFRGGHLQLNHLEVDGFKCISGDKLGCYFCNDIVAPGNSMKERTLDQQCTVSRPAASNIASSQVVELMVALTQHPDRECAPAYVRNFKSTAADSIPEGLLGVIPHSIRGSLATFEQMMPATERFSKCIACSETILDAFREGGFGLALEAFNSSRYLEDLTGITELLRDQQDIVECDEDDFELSD